MFEQANAYADCSAFSARVARGEFRMASVVQMCVPGSEGPRARSDGREREPPPGRICGNDQEAERNRVRYFLDGHPKNLSGYRARWSAEWLRLELWAPCDDARCALRGAEGHESHGCWITIDTL